MTGGTTTGAHPWETRRGDGPVLCTAVHEGHAVRDELRPRYALDHEGRRREEDPMTGLWASAGDHAFRSHESRFVVDLNRDREKAVYRQPEDAWGLHVWAEQPTEEMVARSLNRWDAFYALMASWLEGMIQEHGRVLVLDIHSYCHRRDGPDAPPAAQGDNPDIDLGVTTMDQARFPGLLEDVEAALTAAPVAGRTADVRRNVRYPDGGHWPEWISAQYGEDVATITLEVKKIYMDEWTGTADLGVCEDLRLATERAVVAGRRALSR